MSLSDFYKEKALNELRENDLRKKLALLQFREWISKQSHIKNCRTDDNFLLCHLRSRKYFCTEAFMLLEKRLVAIKKFPQWFKNLSMQDIHVKELFDSGYLIPLKERDQNGCRVLICRPSLFDTKKFSADDNLKIFAFISGIFMEEPETQIAGVVFVYDLQNISLEFLSLFSPFFIQSAVKNMFEVQPVRSKAIYVINCPKFACSVIEFITKHLSKKIQQRSHISSDCSALANNIDVNILPLEYGGATPVKDILDEFKVKTEAHRKMVSLNSEMDIDLTQVKGSEPSEDVGSFRKLEID